MNIRDINKLNVSLNFGHKIIEVGELVLENRTIYFRYLEDFLNLKINISPYKLKLNSQIQKVDTQLFDGLFGVFDDSLPDGWGRLLLDRKLQNAGYPFSEINPLMRLAIVGNNGSGALSYRPEFKDSTIENIDFELDDLALETHKILEDEPSALLDNLFKMGGSSGGARPKINLNYSETKDELFFGSKAPSADYSPWIVKFASSFDPKDIANIEYAYYLMALDAGLEMNQSKLFMGKSGKYYFGTKRFDRNDTQRLHMHSLAGMLHDNFRLSSLDYGHVMECAFDLEKNVTALEKVLRIAAFNVFSSNKDDHSKNISFLMDENGQWTLAPAYDITFSNSSHGHHSITLAGESKSPSEMHLKKLAATFRIEKADIIISEVKEAVSNWSVYAEKALVSKSSASNIKRAMKSLLVK